MPTPPYILKIRQFVGHDWVLLNSACPLVFNDAGDVLLHRRTDDGRWSVLGGALDPGETSLEGAIREAYEEAGVRVVPERLTGIYSGWDNSNIYPNGDKSIFTTVAFKCRIVDGTPHVNDDESYEVGFFSPDNLPDSLLPRHRLRIEHATQRDDVYFQIPDEIPTEPDISYLKRMRSVVGHDLLISPGATAIITNDSGEILVQQRRDNGKWNLVGGLQEVGECPAGTILREIVEETGLHVTLKRLVGVYGGEDYIVSYPNGDVMSYVNFVFLCHSDTSAVHKDAESIALAWVKPDALPQPFDAKHCILIDHAFSRSTPYFDGIIEGES